LSGGGVVRLTTQIGGGTPIVEGNGQTLTNDDVAIKGTGTVGNGSLALANGGTIDADVPAGTLVLNGTGKITNTGVFEATNGGILDVAGAFAGAGQIGIGAGSEVELGGATSENTTFLGALSAKLSIDNATKTTYGGVINSFVSGDILELGNTDATKATPTSFNGADTTLTVDLSGGGTLSYTLAGNLTADTFSVTHANGDSDIAIATTPAFEQAYSLLRHPKGSSFVDSSGLFGHSATHGFSEHALAGWAPTHS
jgi:hypothetical protein